jgi:hypothetical protein
MTTLTAEQEKAIEYVIDGVPFLSFNRAQGTFEVSDAVSDPSWEQAQLVREAVRRIRLVPLPFPPLRAVRVDQLATGYFDRCLERYCHERLNLMIPHEQTCWVRFARKAYCVGRVDPGTEFNDLAKARFAESLGQERSQDLVAMSIYRAYHRNPEIKHGLKRDAEGWVMFHLGDIPLQPLGRAMGIGSRAKGCIKKMLRYQENDRVLRLVRNIEAHGWDRAAASGDFGVLGYSRATGRHFTIVGKHRIAAVKYLHSEGRIAGSTLIHYAVITYPWEQWFRRRPYPGASPCEQCRWWKLAPGLGTSAA